MSDISIADGFALLAEGMQEAKVAIADATKELKRLNEENTHLKQTATAFYKRVEHRVPGLVEQIEDVAKPLRAALGMED